jgi:hypothetical protein
MADLNRLLPEMFKHENRVVVGEKGMGSTFFFFFLTRVKALMDWSIVVLTNRGFKRS